MVLFFRREAGSGDLDFVLHFGGEAIAQEGADGGNEEEEADGVGEEARGEEDGAGDEDEDAIGCLTVGHAAFGECGLKPGHGLAALGLGQGGTEDGGEDDDDDGGLETDEVTQHDEDDELGQGDEDEEEEEFSKHGYAGRYRGWGSLPRERWRTMEIGSRGREPNPYLGGRLTVFPLCSLPEM